MQGESNVPAGVPGVQHYRVTPATTRVTGRRIVAFVLDLIIINLLQIPFVIPMALFLSESQYDAAGWVVSLGTMMVYFTLLEGRRGRTLGKAMLGLRVVMLTGHPISIQVAAGRTVWLLVDSLLAGIPALASVGTSPLRQRLGDRRTNSVVVRATPEPAVSG